MRKVVLTWMMTTLFIAASSMAHSAELEKFTKIAKETITLQMQPIAKPQ